MSPVRLAIASAFRPAPEGRCDGEVVGAAPFAELELRSGNTVFLPRAHKSSMNRKCSRFETATLSGLSVPFAHRIGEIRIPDMIQLVFESQFV